MGEVNTANSRERLIRPFQQREECHYSRLGRRGCYQAISLSLSSSSRSSSPSISSSPPPSTSSFHYRHLHQHHYDILSRYFLARRADYVTKTPPGETMAKKITSISIIVAIIIINILKKQRPKKNLWYLRVKFESQVLSKQFHEL